jgi:hypothetical protein
MLYIEVWEVHGKMTQYFGCELDFFMSLSSVFATRGTPYLVEPTSMFSFRLK